METSIIICKENKQTRALSNLIVFHPYKNEVYTDTTDHFYLYFGFENKNIQQPTAKQKQFHRKNLKLKQVALC